IANTLVERYIAEEKAHHKDTGGKAGEFLTDSMNDAKEKLRKSEEALQNFKKQNNAASLDERQNTVVAKLKELNTKVTEAKSTRIKAESDYAQAQKLGTNVDTLSALPSVASNPTVTAMKLNLSKAENDFAALRQRYKEKHPKFIQAQSQIVELQADLESAI